MSNTHNNLPRASEAAQWWDLGQHEYLVHEQARQKHLQMRDDGHETRVQTRKRTTGTVYVVQIFCL